MAGIIGITNRKGGTGKSTTVLNLAGIFVKKFSLKVLVIDTDPQGNLTMRLLAHDFEEYYTNNGRHNGNFLTDKLTFEDLFLNPELVNEAIYPARIKIRDTAKKRGIDIIPIKPEGSFSKFDLADVERSLITNRDNKQYDIVKNMLSNIKRTMNHRYDYDLIIFDFPPSLTEVSYHCLGACDYILAPATASNNSMDGFSSLLNTINKIKGLGINPNIKLLGMVLTNVKQQAGGYDRQMVNYIRQIIGDNFIDIPIREDTNVKWAEQANIPLIWYRRNSGATKDYILLAEYILKELNLLPHDFLEEYEEGLKEIKERYEFN